MAHQNRLANTTVLIFGGTSGIGFAVANLAVASSAARVILSGTTQQKADAKAALLRSFYPSLAPTTHISGLACDLLDTPNLDANLKSLLDRATDNGARKIDHIVFTAGDGPDTTTLQDMSAEAALHGSKMRILAPLFLAKHFASRPGHYVPASPTSSFTLTGGTNTRKPMPGWVLPATWGAATEGMARGLAVDMRPVRVNLVSVGAVQTELFERFVERVGEEAREKLARDWTLTGRLGRPEDVAEAYGWVMRDTFVTGSVVETEGGRILALGPQ